MGLMHRPSILARFLILWIVKDENVIPVGNTGGKVAKKLQSGHKKLFCPHGNRGDIFDTPIITVAAEACHFL